MYTGTCLRPSCTAIVWPTISGMIVERRDQVLMTFFSLLAFRPSTFFRRWSATDDELLGRLGLVAGATLGLAPRRHGMAATRGLALAAAVRVVDGVHGDA